MCPSHCCGLGSSSLPLFSMSCFVLCARACLCLPTGLFIECPHRPQLSIWGLYILRQVSFFQHPPPDVTEQGGHQNLPIKTRRANTRSRLQTVDIKFNHHTSPDSEFQIHPSPISKLQTPIFIQDSKVKTADSEPGGSKAWNPKLSSVNLSIYPTTSQIAFSGWG